MASRTAACSCRSLRAKLLSQEGTSSVITIKLRNKDDAVPFKNMVKAKFANLIASKTRSSRAPTRSSEF